MYGFLLFTFIYRSVFEHVLLSIVVISIISFTLNLQVVDWGTICLHRIGLILYNRWVFFSYFMIMNDVVLIWNIFNTNHFLQSSFWVYNVLK